jgi:hypothetical protein
VNNKHIDTYQLIIHFIQHFIHICYHNWNHCLTYNSLTLMINKFIAKIAITMYKYTYTILEHFFICFCFNFNTLTQFKSECVWAFTSKYCAFTFCQFPNFSQVIFLGILYHCIWYINNNLDVLTCSSLQQVSESEHIHFQRLYISFGNLHCSSLSAIIFCFDRQYSCDPKASTITCIVFIVLFWNYLNSFIIKFFQTSHLIGSLYELSFNLKCLLISQVKH